MPNKSLRRPPYTATPNEADLPAEEAEARQDAWIPSPDEHPRGPRDPQAPPPQRPQAPDGLVAPQRRRRLSRSGDFDRVYRDGSSNATRYLVLYSFPRKDEGDSVVRLGVSASRKLGGAVDRNRVKRGLRDAVWSLSERLPERHDFVIVARPELAELIEREGAAGVTG